MNNLWKKLPVAWQKEIVSGFHTFLTAAMLEISLELSSGKFPVGKDAFLALGAVAVRAGMRALWGTDTAQTAPPAA